MQNIAEVRQLSELAVFIATAQPGAIARYHRGYLARDREPHYAEGVKDADVRKQMKLEAEAVNSLAFAVIEAVARGELCLLQHRIGCEVFDYFAVRSSSEIKSVAA